MSTFYSLKYTLHQKGWRLFCCSVTLENMLRVFLQ